MTSLPGVNENMEEGILNFALTSGAHENTV